jgi:hypothetical protein
VLGEVDLLQGEGGGLRSAHHSKVYPASIHRPTRAGARAEGGEEEVDTARK